MAGRRPKFASLQRDRQSALGTTAHWLDRVLIAQGERRARRLWPELPYTIRLDHLPTADPRPRYADAFTGLLWSEQYLLAALLLARAPWLDIVLPTFYVSGQPELAALLDPLFARPGLTGVNRRGSTFWIETR